eukprot:scaffold155593_cov33-Tisochrysis_lutea.AAC.2
MPRALTVTDSRRLNSPSPRPITRRCGHGDEEDVPLPRPIEGLRGIRIRSVAAGACFSVAVAEDGCVWGWGEMGSNGRDAIVGLHRPDNANRALPMQYLTNDGDEEQRPLRLFV